MPNYDTYNTDPYARFLDWRNSQQNQSLNPLKGRQLGITPDTTGQGDWQTGSNVLTPQNAVGQGMTQVGEGKYVSNSLAKYYDNGQGGTQQVSPLNAGANNNLPMTQNSEMMGPPKPGFFQNQWNKARNSYRDSPFNKAIHPDSPWAGGAQPAASGIVGTGGAASPASGGMGGAMGYLGAANAIMGMMNSNKSSSQPTMSQPIVVNNPPPIGGSYSRGERRNRLSSLPNYQRGGLTHAKNMVIGNEAGQEGFIPLRNPEEIQAFGHGSSTMTVGGSPEGDVITAKEAGVVIPNNLLKHILQNEQYRNWKKANPTQDTRNYNMKGYQQKYGVPDMSGGQHLTDEYKMPGHITFSNESRYSNEKTPGGSWSQDENGKFTFTPSGYNLKRHPANKLQQYFDKYEPKTSLNFPHMQYGGEFDEFGNPIQPANALIRTMSRETPNNQSVFNTPTQVAPTSMESPTMASIEKPGLFARIGNAFRPKEQPIPTDYNTPEGANYLNRLMSESQRKPTFTEKLPQALALMSGAFDPYGRFANANANIINMAQQQEQSRRQAPVNYLNQVMAMGQAANLPLQQRKLQEELKMMPFERRNLKARARLSEAQASAVGKPSALEAAKTKWYEAKSVGGGKGVMTEIEALKGLTKATEAKAKFNKTGQVDPVLAALMQNLGVPIGQDNTIDAKDRVSANAAYDKLITYYQNYLDTGGESVGAGKISPEAEKVLNSEIFNMAKQGSGKAFADAIPKSTQADGQEKVVNGKSYIRGVDGAWYEK